MLDGLGRSPHYIAVEKNNEAIARLLVIYRADVNASDLYGTTPLHVAVLNESEKLVLEYGAGVNSIDGNGRAPIHNAVARRGVSEKIVKILLDWKADINIEDKQGCTP